SAVDERGCSPWCAGAKFLLLSQPAARRRADPRQPAVVARRASPAVSARAGAARRRHAVDSGLRAARVGRDAARGPQSASASHRAAPAQHGHARARIVTRAAVAAALLVALIATTPVGDAGAAKSGGTLRMVFVSDPPTLDPAQATDLTSSSVICQVFDALLELDDKLVPTPALAERWTVSADQRTYTFFLRRGVKFHNGREMRAADVKYSFERAARGKRPWVFEKLSGAKEFIKGAAGGGAGGCV